MLSTIIVVPCFNEADRLDGDAFVGSVDASVGWIFVDDGSTDDTGSCLDRLRDRCPERIRVIHLDRNRGKGEAVRQGLLAACADRADVVGYLDADLSTPVAEVPRLIETLERTGARGVLGSRVKLLGREIHRRPARHYLGRIFATGASLTLDLPVYDTQCGAKIFENSPALRAALAEPFASRWIFDVELLARLLAGTEATEGWADSDLVEMPLLSWEDKQGSKLSWLGALRGGADLLRLALTKRRKR